MLPNNGWGHLDSAVIQMMIAKLRVVLNDHQVLLRCLMHVLDDCASARIDHLAVQFNSIVRPFAVHSYFLH